MNNQVGNLLNYCLVKNNWAPNLEEYPVHGLINSIEKIEKFSEKWSFEEAINGIYNALVTLSSDLINYKPPVEDKYVDKFIEEFTKYFTDSICDHWIIVPLPNTNLDEIVNFQDFHILPSSLSEFDKIKYLSEISKITEEEMNKRASHTKNSRSESFFLYTLLCVRINHHSDWVEVNALKILNLVITIFRLLIYSNSLNEENLLGSYSTLLMRSLKPNHHLMILRQGHMHWYTHRSLWTKKNNIGFLGDIEWIKKEEYQKQFIALFDFLLANNNFSQTYYRSALFFNRSLLFQSGEKEIFEGIGLEVLHLIIAAENILLDRRSEKKLRVAVLLSRLLNESKIQKEIFNALIDLYDKRSEYVHSGADIHKNYLVDYDKNEINLNLIRWGIAKLIISGVIFYNEKLVNMDKKDFLNVWRNHLDSIWTSVLSG